MYIIIVGGGNVGTVLAKRLIARGHEVLLLEKEIRQAQHLTNMLGEEHVMLGDACEVFIQKSAGFNRADVVVAVTGEDEDNLVACQMAKVLWKVDRVVARVNDSSHEDIFKEIGIDDIVSATGLIFNLIDQQISSGELIPVGALRKGQLEIVESVLGPRSPLVGREVRDLELPHGTFIVYLQREGAGMIVDGATVLQAEDTVVAMVPTESAAALKAVLCDGR